VNGVAAPEAALPLPGHLAGRFVNRTVVSIYIKSGSSGPEESFRCGTIEDWWPLLTPEQQHGVLMASIMAVDSLTNITEHVMLFRDGDIRVVFTKEGIKSPHIKSTKAPKQRGATHESNS